MKIQIVKAVMVMGTPVFSEQVTGIGKTEKREPTIIDVDKKIAVELVRSRQAKKADVKAEVNFKIKTLEKDDDPLDEFFGDESEELDEE